MNAAANTTIDSLNERLYKAARKAGFEQALFYAHVEVTNWAPLGCPLAEPYITWNHDHEPSDDVAPLDMDAIKRAQIWLEKALAAASPWQIEITFSEAGDEYKGKFGTFAAVDRQLRKIQTEAGRTLGYMKTDFIVKHSSGEEYKGRIDVQGVNHPAPSLKKHMVQHCEFLLSDKAARLISGKRLAEARAAGKLWIGLLA